ncbi:hypothetical protein BD770DRAFT_412322 [Pilaira anomala]|nr:hypothetical protein BD770DRAFT_412322 [Pilaira anomala]
MPLVVFGDGMFNKDDVPLTSQLHGVTSTLYKNLKRRERLGELCLIDINEFQTSTPLQGNFKVLRYTRCQDRLVTWNRNTNAARNMWDISSSSGQDVEDLIYFAGNNNNNNNNKYFLYRHLKCGVFRT